MGKKSKKLKGYEGFFLNEESVEKIISNQGEKLPNVVDDMHVTFKFGELDRFPDNAIGRELNLKVVGYASDGKNSGFKVELPEFILEEYGTKNPHVTVSLGDEIEGEKKPSAKDTANLDFKELSKEEQFDIKGDLGYFIFGKGIVKDNEKFDELQKAKLDKIKEKNDGAR